MMNLHMEPVDRSCMFCGGGTKDNPCTCGKPKTAAQNALARDINHDHLKWCPRGWSRGSTIACLCEEIIAGMEEVRLQDPEEFNRWWMKEVR